MWLQELPNSISLHNVRVWVDGKSQNDKKTKTAYTFSNITFGALANNGRQMTFNGSTSKIALGNLGNIKTVIMWVNPTTDTEFFIELSATAFIISSLGTIITGGFSGDTHYVNGVQTSTISEGAVSLLCVTSATAVSATACNIGAVGLNALQGTVNSIILLDRQISATEIGQLYNKHK